MCEPNQSVTQWPDPKVAEQIVELIEPDFLKEEVLQGAHVRGTSILDEKVQDEIAQWVLDADQVTLPRLQIFLGEDAKLLSKIGEFYHLSRFGEGHSESRASRLGHMALVPRYSAYEVEWWERKIKFDFGSSTHSLYSVRRNAERTRLYTKIEDLFKQEALAACEKYALVTSIGDPGVLRRFLEETILTSIRMSDTYMEPFRKMFSAKGVLEFESRLKLAEIPLTLEVGDPRSMQRTRLAKVICGMTRKRQFMNAEWADIPRFWK